MDNRKVKVNRLLDEFMCDLPHLIVHKIIRSNTFHQNYLDINFFLMQKLFAKYIMYTSLFVKHYFYIRIFKMVL